MSDNKAGPADHLFDTPDLAGALESDRFKQFLDHIPVAIAVSELLPSEHIIYANIEFERLTGQKASEIYSDSAGTRTNRLPKREIGILLTE
jgi:PAS domain-containing protein